MADPLHGGTSANVYLNAIEWGGWVWDTPGPGTNIFYFIDSSAQDLSGAFGAGFGTGAPWLSYESAAYRAALQTWGNVANITFTEVATRSAADLVAFNYNGSGSSTLGIHETPQGAFQSDGTAWGAFNYAARGWSSTGLQAGGYGFVTLVHELGHSLGLAHPHDNGGGSGIFPGVTGSSSAGSNFLNQGIFTIMSYIDGWGQGPGAAGLSASDNYGWSATPMAFDVAAIQFLYGANTSYHAGGDAYFLPGSNGAGTSWSCIWDAGGSDGIYYSGASNATIDLRAATLDNTPNGGGYVSFVTGIIGGFTIANGVVIETAVSGSGNDTINGNDVGNNLYGGLGVDTITAGSGNDIVVGGAGGDFLYAGAGNDVISELFDIVNSGNDVIYAGSGIDIIYAADGNDTVDGGSDGGNNFADLGNGNDSYSGANGVDVVLGGQGIDTIEGWGGDDSLYGGTEGDTMYGDLGGTTSLGDGFAGGIDLVAGGDGNDFLYGNGGPDQLNGDLNDDTLYGQEGIDILYGGAGNDIVNGGPSTDGLYGGTGADTFQVGGVGFGLDFIWDYSAAQGDVLSFQIGTATAISTSGGNTYFTMQNGNTSVVVVVGYTGVVNTNFNGTF
jgi:serralysin